MSSPVQAVKPKDTIFDAAKVMGNKNIGAVVVLDESEALLGIVTERDILCKVLGKGLDYKATKMEDIMTKNVRTVDPDSSLLDVCKIMTKNKFRRMVVTENGKVVGIITASDLIELFST